MHFWRLRTVDGLSNPMRFVVGQHQEVREAEPPLEFDLDRYNASASVKKPLRHHAAVFPPRHGQWPYPAGRSGQFSFHAKKGQQVVLVSMHAASSLIWPMPCPDGFRPWSPSTDSSGHEVAFADGYRFDPDPVVFYKIPEDGDYRIEVRDSIYRGREDFVYRITLGELPFLTGISPLGATAGTKVDLTFQGGNLGDNFRQRYTAPIRPGLVFLHATNGQWRSNSDSLPGGHAGRGTRARAQQHIRRRLRNQTADRRQRTHRARGDADYFRLKGRGNKEMIFEILRDASARRSIPAWRSLTPMESRSASMTTTRIRLPASPRITPTPGSVSNFRPPAIASSA